MASIVNYDGGLKRIEFSLAPNGPRKMIRLGRVSMKIAESWQAKIEAIIADKLSQRPHDAELSKWLGTLDEAMLKRMRDVRDWPKVWDYLKSRYPPSWIDSSQR